MRNIWAIAKREILSFFVSPIAYFVITGFIMLGGYFFINLLAIYNVVVTQYMAMPYRQMEGPNLNEWVIQGYYQTLVVILVFLIPLLTMRVIAEERRRGTFELLATSPVKVSEIIFGKFLGLAVVILIMLLTILTFPLLVWAFVEPRPEILPILSGFGGLVLCALAFASLGMAVSAFTENQIVAGISGMVTLLLLYVIHSPAETLGGALASVLNYISPVMQLRDLFKGVVSLKAIVYFLSLVSFGLFLSQRALEAQRWR